MISDSTRTVIVRRIILTNFRASSTPVMRMLITMLLRLTTLATAKLRLSRSIIWTLLCDWLIARFDKVTWQNVPSVATFLWPRLVVVMAWTTWSFSHIVQSGQKSFYLLNKSHCVSALYINMCAYFILNYDNLDYLATKQRKLLNTTGHHLFIN